MKKIKIIVFLFMVSTMFIACGGSDDTNDSNNPTSDKIIGNWKLIGSQDANGVFTAAPSCLLVFSKFSANGDYELSADQCGQSSALETGTWSKTTNSQEYTINYDDPDTEDDTETLNFFENNTKFSGMGANGEEVIYQKQ